ncbi:MAG: GAF domain-containing protein, partial [Chloroflexota bacterium]
MTAPSLDSSPPEPDTAPTPPADPAAVWSPAVRLLLQNAAEEAARLLGAHGAFLYLLDAETQRLRFTHDAGTAEVGRQAWVRELELPVGVGMFGKSVEQRRVLVSDDYPNDTTFPHAEGPDRLVREVGIRSLVVAPLLAGQDAYGALGTFSREPAAFTAPQIALVRALADHAAGALANARLIEELGRSREELARRADIERSLREIGARISAAHDTADVVQRAVDEALRLLAGDGARIDLVDPVLGLLRKAYMSGAEQPTEEEWPDDPDERLDEGISGRAVVESRTVWTGDYMADQAIRHGRGPDTYVASRGIRSAMAAPLVGADGAFGAVTVWSGRTDAFGATDASVLETIAGQASVAIGRARLIEELQRSREEVARRAEEERALREIGARLSNIADPASVLERIVEESARLLGAERVRLDLVEPLSGQDLWTHPASWIERDRSPLSGPGGPAGARGITGLSIRESRTIVSPDYLEDERFEHYDDADTEVAAVGMCSITATPVFGESGLQGVLQLGSRDRNAFGDDQVRLVERLAAQAAVAITNARLVDRLETSQAALGKKAGAERALREIAGRMMSIQDPGDLLQQVVDEAARLLGSRGAVIDLMDTATGDIRRGYDAGIDEALRETWESTRARTAGIRKAIRERRVVVTDDAAGDTDSGSDPAGHVLLERGVKAVACAPLIGEAGALGTLSVFAADPDAFDHDAAELLGALAGQATIAIRNAELIRELGRSREELSRRAETERTLREIAARITSIRDNEGILALIVDEARRVLGSDGAHLTRMVDARRVLRPVVVAGGTDPETREWLQNMEFPLNAGINGLAAGLGRVVWTPHYALDPRIPRERDDLDVAERLGLGAMAAAPLRAPGGEVIGTLAISYRTPGPIRAERLEVLQALADHAAIALSNSDLLERLEESEARYRRLVQATPDVIWQVDAEGRLSFIADSAAQLFGWPAAELTGRHFSELVADESRGLAAEGWTTLTSQHDRSWRLRLVLRRQDGTTFPSEVSAVSFSDDGQFAGGQGTIRDISERERLERDLRESEERYRDLVQLSPDLIFAMDGEGVYTFFSARTTETIGWRPEELVGRPFRDFLDLESFPNAAEEWTKFSAEPGRPTVNRMHLRHKDGRLIPFEVSAVGQVEDGELVAVRGVARDIGERERLEAELRASEERYRFLVENSPDVVFATDPEGRFTFMSETIERAIGRSPTEIVGNHFSTIVAQDALPYAAARWEALVADPFTLQTVRLKLVRADGGDPVPVEVSAIGIVDGDGRFAGIHGSTRDISERERLLAELRESEERHRVLVQSSPDLIFAIDPEGRYTFMSDRVE